MNKDKKSFYTKLVIFGIMILVFCIGQFFAVSTMSRYVIKYEEKFKAYYTDLYLVSNAEGKVAVIEDNSALTLSTGTVAINLYNYLGTNITGRDIKYQIYTPTVHTDQNTGNKYVDGVFGSKVAVTDATSNYNISVLGENSPVTHQLTSRVNEFGDPIGSSEALILNVQRSTPNTFSSDGVEYVSIVVNIIEPYMDVRTFTIAVSKKLIVFSVNETTKFGFNNIKLFTQTAKTFTNAYDIKAFRLRLKWQNVKFDSTMNDILKHSGNENTPSNVDISEPYLLSFDEENREAIFYVPSASDFSLDFYTFMEGNGLKKIDVYIELIVSGSSTYTGYSGYQEDDGTGVVTGYHLIYAR